jgi:hypothetical protein
VDGAGGPFLGSNVSDSVVERVQPEAVAPEAAEGAVALPADGDEDVAAVAAVERVLAGAGVEAVVSRAAGEDVVAGAAVEQDFERDRRVDGDHVVAVAAVHANAAVLAAQDVRLVPVLNEQAVLRLRNRDGVVEGGARDLELHAAHVGHVLDDHGHQPSALKGLGDGAADAPHRGGGQTAAHRFSSPAVDSVHP